MNKYKIQAIIFSMENELAESRKAIEQYPGYNGNEFFEGKIAVLTERIEMLKDVINEWEENLL